MGVAHAPQVVQEPLPPQELEPYYTLKIVNFTGKLAKAISDKDYGIIQSEPQVSSTFLRACDRKNSLKMCLQNVFMPTCEITT